MTLEEFRAARKEVPCLLDALPTYLWDDIELNTRGFVYPCNLHIEILESGKAYLQIGNFEMTTGDRGCVFEDLEEELYKFAVDEHMF